MSWEDYPDVDVPPPYGDEAAPSVFAHSWRPVDLTGVLDGTWTPPQPTIGLRADKQAICYPARVHTLASESEAGKTWLSLSVSDDELDAGNHVVYIDFEDDEGGIVGRLLALGADRNIVRDRFHYVRPAERLGTGINLDDLRTLLAETRPTLVVLVGVTAAMTLHGLDVVSNMDVAEFSRILPAGIAATGPAVLVLDHVVKSAEHRGRYALGAVHKLNGVTGAALLLEAVVPFRVGSTGRSRLRIAKDRPGQLRRHALPALDDTGMDWFADLVVESHAEDFVKLTIEPPDDGPPRHRPEAADGLHEAGQRRAGDHGRAAVAARHPRPGHRQGRVRPLRGRRADRRGLRRDLQGLSQRDPARPPQTLPGGNRMTPLLVRVPPCPVRVRATVPHIARPRPVCVFSPVGRTRTRTHRAAATGHSEIQCVRVPLPHDPSTPPEGEHHDRHRRRFHHQPQLAGIPNRAAVLRTLRERAGPAGTQQTH